MCKYNAEKSYKEIRNLVIMVLFTYKKKKKLTEAQAYLKHFRM